MSDIPLNELSEDEQVVLMGLLREVVQADGDYTDAERSEVSILQQELGDDAFLKSMKAAQEKFTSRDKLVEAARLVTRPEAQRAIMNRLIQMAAVDGFDDAEEKPLRWLGREWKVNEG